MKGTADPNDDAACPYQGFWYFPYRVPYFCSWIKERVSGIYADEKSTAIVSAISLASCSALALASLEQDKT
jgi:hypothetical protein